MKQTLITSTILATTLAISGCASLKPPVRPIYTGADLVSNAEASQLVGIWKTIDLNPYPNTEPDSQDVVIEYRADGTVRGVVTPKAQSASVLGETSFEFLGNWSLEGDTVKHQDIQMETVGESPVAGLIGKLVNKNKNIAGQANIYELSADRMVMVSDDGNAMEYVRQ